MPSPPQRARLPLVATVALVLAAIAVMAIARRGKQAAALSAVDDSPAGCIARLIAAERAGDVAGYLDCFTVNARQPIETAWSELAEPARAASLRAQTAELMGFAVVDQQLDPARPDRAVLVVERVFHERRDRQTCELVRESDRWRIAGAGAVETVTPSIRYGAPVEPQ